MKCCGCGISELTSGDVDGLCSSCRSFYKEQHKIQFIPIGWICPKCNKVYNPHITECISCNYKVI